MGYVLNLLNILEQTPKLMYRPAGRDSYINITDAFDEIFNRLDLIEARLNNMELQNVKTNAPAAIR